MNGFGYDLELETRGLAGLAAPLAAITSLEVLGPTPLPDGSDAVAPNGWAMKAVLPDTGAAFDPSKITLLVRDPGFDGSGNPAFVFRTVSGTVVIRRQWPNQAQRLNSVSGGTRTVYFALSDHLYAGSNILGATAAPGFHGSAAAGAVVGVLNGSTRTYPKPLFAWLNLPHERATGSALAVESVAYHRWARNGQQVACVKYQARDTAGNSTAEVVVSAPELSQMQTEGQIVECWRAAVPMAGLNNGELCRVNARIYPWIGDASAVLDLIADGEQVTGALTTACPQTPLRFVCDRTGAYGGNAAWVRAGATGGAVNAPLTPFPTIAAALAALATANAAKGHADHSGSTVYLMDDGAGGAVAHAIAGNVTTPAGQCFTDIRRDPAATGAVSITMTAARTVPSYLRFRVDISHVSGNGFDGTAGAAAEKAIAFEGMALTGTGATVPINYRNPLCFMRNMRVTGYAAAANPLDVFANNALTKNVMLLGVICESAVDVPLAAYTVIGGKFERIQYEEMSTTGRPAYPAQNGCIVANNLFLNIRDANRRGVGCTRALPRGFAAVQNVWESARVGSSGALWEIGADGRLMPLENIVFMHNTMPALDGGGRFNIGYTDAQDVAGIVKEVHCRYNLWPGHWNFKSDTFASGQGGTATSTGRVGNWSIRYGVGQHGNVIGTASDGSIGTDPSGGAWLGEWWHASNRLGGVNVAFADNRSGSGGAGRGLYGLSGAVGDAHGRVAAGSAALRYDLAGRPRRNDGTGAAGAYERLS